MATYWNSCGNCDVKWTGDRTCHCGACHLTFTCLSAFDTHRKDFGCLHPGAVGLVTHERGGREFRYEAWGRPGDDEASQRFAKYREERTSSQGEGEPDEEFKATLTQVMDENDGLLRRLADE